MAPWKIMAHSLIRHKITFLQVILWKSGKGEMPPKKKKFPDPQRVESYKFCGLGIVWVLWLCVFSSWRRVCAGALLMGSWCELMLLCSCFICLEFKSRRHKEHSFGSVSSTGPEHFHLCQIWKLLKRVKNGLLVHTLVNAQRDLVGLVSLES